MKVLATFTSKLLSNHARKMAQVSIEINGNLYFSQIWNLENFETLYTALDVSM